MSVVTIPLDYDGTSTDFDQVTALDGTNYLCYFSYNSRDEHWYLSIRTAENEEIQGCEGMKLVKNGWPIRRVYDLNRPPGEIYVHCPDDMGEPGLNSFNEGAELQYMPRADVLDLFA